MKNHQLTLSYISGIFSILLALIVGQSFAVFSLIIIFYCIGHLVSFSIERPNRKQGIILFNWVFSSLILFAILHYLYTVVNYNDFAVDWRDEYKFWVISEDFAHFNSLKTIYQDSFSLYKFKDLPGYAFYIGSLGFLAEHYFDGNHLLLQFIGTAIWSGMSSLLLYKIFLLYFHKKIAYIYAIQFALLTVSFAYSFMLLRDIIIAFFYLWVFYIILKKFHLVGILKILLIILIVWQLRLEHALFLLVFLIYYIYYGLKINKIFLWISIIGLGGALIVLFSRFFISALATVDRYGTRSESKALEVSDSLGKSLYNLPSPIQEMAFFITSQIRPFPSWNSLSNSSGFYDGIVSFLPIVYTLFWFVVVFSLLKMLIVHKVYQNISKELNMLLLICGLFLFIVSLGSSDARRIMAVYPIVFLFYAFGQSKMKKSQNKKMKIEAIFSYLLLIGVYLFLKA